MEAGNDKFINPPDYVFCAISSNTKIKSIMKNVMLTSLKRASPAAIKSPITIVDGVLQERSIWLFLNTSDQFFLDKCFTGVHDSEQ